MPIRFKSAGTILFQSSGVISFGEDCCCEPVPIDTDTCCADENDWTWATDYPLTLTATITGACCANRNGTYTLDRNPAPGAVPSYLPRPLEGSRCDGSTHSAGYIGLGCVNGDWSWMEAECISLGPVSYPMTLWSCNPLHITVTGVGLIVGVPGRCCTGSYDVEITE